MGVYEDRRVKDELINEIRKLHYGSSVLYSARKVAGERGLTISQLEEIKNFLIEDNSKRGRRG